MKQYIYPFTTNIHNIKLVVLTQT